MALARATLFHPINRLPPIIMTDLSELACGETGGVRNIPDILIGQEGRRNFATIGPTALRADGQTEGRAICGGSSAGGNSD
jgi:hypothetical protein